MLILTRRPGENIRINDDIIIKALPSHGYQIRIGIDAPPEYKIQREELYDRILAENSASCISDCASSKKQSQGEE